MKFFVDENSIVRQIWGKGDTVLLIFAGASAEFALNKAVDWLYYTGKLPADPLGRLFSTVNYARRIVFAQQEDALATIDKIASIHNAVERSRGDKIPDWAYRDVLYMLIHYSIASFELLERKLTADEKEETFNVFYRLGHRMGLKDLPADYKEWQVSRAAHLQQNLTCSHFTKDLFKQYRKHLGLVRYSILKEGQILVIPDEARKLLKFRKLSLLSPVLVSYKMLRYANLHNTLRSAILPSKYRQEISELDVAG